MKKFFLFILIAVAIVSACSHPPELASTPMKAAKTFVQALTTGDEALLNTVIYHSQSMPANEIMNIAKMRKITGMKQSDFTFSKDPDDKDTIFVSFKDSSGMQDEWKLVFLEDDSEKGNYQYDGNLSGPLLSNTTPTNIAQSFLKSFIHFNNYWLNNISDPISKSSINFTYDEAWRVVRKFGINKKKINDFYIPKSDQQSKYITINIEFKDKDKVSRTLHVICAKYDDGYYYQGFRIKEEP